MKKSRVALLMVPLMAIGCNKSLVNMPKSPFGADEYSPIGMTTAFPDVKLSSLDNNEYQLVKNNIANYQADEMVSSYTRHEESRDLRYAYFGNQEPTLCTYTSSDIKLDRYSNPITISKNVQNNKNQTLSGSIINDHLTDEIYTQSIPDKDHMYHVIESIKKNDAEAKVQKTKTDTSYSDAEIVTIFGLKPFEVIQTSHFTEKAVHSETEVYKFKLFGDENNAVYGKAKINGVDQFLIKEAYSLFVDYQTVGHRYKAVDNYFYEGLLKEVDSSNKKLGFTSFRFYHEFLILSEPADRADVPILYLEKPMLVEYNEYRYDISYDVFKPYQGDVPTPTK